MKKILLILFLLITPLTVNAESHYLYDVLKNEAENNGLAKEYTGDHHDSFTEEPSKKIYHWYAENEEEANQLLEKSNVIFANQCWQIIRTTDTGGVKIMFNGYSTNGKCTNERMYQAMGPIKYSNNCNSIAHFGYMQDTNNILIRKGPKNAKRDSIFGNRVTYTNGLYTLVDTSNRYDNYHHYTCDNTTGICETVEYFYSGYYYTELNDGRDIEQALHDMLTKNTIDSEIKRFIDSWYEESVSNYSHMIEDTIYCNNREIKNYRGWNPNGGVVNGGLTFKDYSENYDDNYADLSCLNETDKFSLNNEKAKLKYPVGLPTKSEYLLLGNHNFFSIGLWYWLNSPSAFGIGNAAHYVVSSIGTIADHGVTSAGYVRPVISLKSGSKYFYGDGSKNNPFIIEETNYYKVIVEEKVKKGDIEFETEDITNLLEGTEVKFKITPIKGYKLKDLTITDEEENNVDYTTKDNINFKFTMPATDVTIKPQYKEIESNIINPNTSRQLLLIVISVIILGIMTFIFIKKKKRLI